MKKLFSVLATSAVMFSAQAQTTPYYWGDVNHDGQITEADVTTLVDMILGKIDKDTISFNGTFEVYKNGVLDTTYVSDSNNEYKVVFKADQPAEHEYVDLGLPSGTLWATCNIGAENPEDAGLYFAWGEKKGHTSDTSDGYSYNWKSTPFNNGLSDYSSDYFENIGRAEATGSATGTELVATYDAATVKWGNEWQMPSLTQIKELIDECTWTWDADKRGYSVSKNDKFIFIPAGGLRVDAIFYGWWNYGSFYWSRTLESYPSYACGLFFNSGIHGWSNCDRYRGRSIRAVRVQK